MPEGTTVGRILGAVETLPADACGAFAVELEDEHVGSVLVEKNQVCWAVATGMRRRLLDLLRESLVTMLDKDELEALHARCVAEGRRVGEELVARSMVRGDVMRTAIKQHTIESLLALPERLGERVDWVAHRAAGYSPRFTFSPVELYVGVNARLYPTEAASSELPLAPVAIAGARGASFAKDDDGFPLAVRAAGDFASLTELVELGAWADAAFGATPGFSAEVLARAVADVERHGREVALAWRSSRFLVHAAVVGGRDAVSRLVGELARRGYPTVLSWRASSPPRAITTPDTYGRT